MATDDDPGSDDRDSDDPGSGDPGSGDPVSEAGGRTGYLAGRTVVVTGAAGGFGRLISARAADRGARVVLTDIDASGVEGAAADLRGAGGDAEGIAADVRVLDDMKAVVARALERFGSVDVMVNNAGTMPLAFYSDHAVAWEAWDRCIDINLKGTLNGICAVYDQMIAQGRGHVVNISSIYGNAGTEGSAVYSATKAAVVVLADSLRKEARGRIKVTTVRPTGVIGTGLGASVVNPVATSGITGRHQDDFISRVMAHLGGTLEGPEADIDDPRFWAIEPETIAAEVIHAIDQPWGVTISDVTVRATGEDYVI